MNALFREYRSKKGITLNKLSEKSSVSIGTISKWENGKSDIGVGKLKMICNAAGLNLRMIDFLDDNGDVEINGIIKIKINHTKLERSFTEREISTLQSAVYKITGKGKVMQEFNRLLGINAT